MDKRTEERWWHRLFEWSLGVKGFYGALEVVGGFIVLFVSRFTFDRWFQLLARKEILEDPHDFLMNYLASSLTGLLASAKIFAALYILIHGLLNIFIAIELYRNRIWAYLAAMAVMLTVIAYQIYRVVIHHSIFLLAVTVLDFLFVILTWHEYKRLKDLIPIKP